MPANTSRHINVLADEIDLMATVVYYGEEKDALVKALME